MESGIALLLQCNTDHQMMNMIDFTWRVILISISTGYNFLTFKVTFGLILCNMIK